ncbi:MAG: glycoside hydrolase family 127 protein [Clostridia bacterium]|nr:glycoside hydrolase family 127 protein [Clostridia bacterium]
MKFCPECGAPLKEQMRFCTSCGADLSAHLASEARRKAKAAADAEPKSAPGPFDAEPPAAPDPTVLTPDAKIPADGEGADVAALVYAMLAENRSYEEAYALLLSNAAVKLKFPDEHALSDELLRASDEVFRPRADIGGMAFCAWASAKLITPSDPFAAVLSGKAEETEAETEPEPKPEPKPETVPELILTSEALPKQETVPELILTSAREPKPEPAPILFTEPEPVVLPEPEPETEPEPAAEPEPIPEPEAEPEFEPEPEAEPEPEPEIQPEPEPEPEPKIEPEPEPEIQPEPEEIPEPEPISSLADPAAAVCREAIRRAKDHLYYSDVRFELPAGSFDFDDALSAEADAILDAQLLDSALWAKFVHLFKNPGVDDADLGWRCEYWGKMMRGACFLFKTLPACEKAERLYSVLEETVRDLLTAQDELGRFSTYSVGAEFQGWDLWGRKYVMLGFLYFLDICRDNALALEIVEALKRHADYMTEKLGRPEEGKRVIAACTSHWDGLNSCSILEPFMLLYNITREKRYFDFAEYIVSFGGTLHQNLFELAYEDRVSIRDYGVTKAYEMISCFEGLAEYAKVTGDEKARETVIRFAERVLKEEETVIGCLGCLYESFDGSAAEQFDPGRTGIMQETCVTVTWMKFCWQLWRMTGENKWIDALEKAAYNAMSASLRRHADAAENGGVLLPVHSYNPLRYDVRAAMVGGKKTLDPAGNSSYGCCVCISSAGFALDTLAAAALDRKGTVYVNLYRNGTLTVGDFSLTAETDYPLTGVIRFRTGSFSGTRDLVLRIPGWAKHSALTVNGVSVRDGIGSYALTVSGEQEFTLSLDMPAEAVTPAEAARIDGDCDLPGADRYLAVRRGPVFFALDEDPETEAAGAVLPGSDPLVPIDAARIALGEAAPLDPASSPVPCRQRIRVPLAKPGNYAALVDYASAGQEKGHRVSVWIRVK